jgi:hypothetical protein
MNKNIKSFKQFKNSGMILESSHNLDISPLDFAKKWDDQYKFIVYKNGKALTGWEYLSDAFINGIAENILDISSDDISEFEDIAESFLSDVNISLSDDVEDIDEDALNDTLSEILNYYDFDENVLIKFVSIED